MDVRATAARITADALIVEFEDGRTMSVPIVWYPRLMDGTPKEQKNLRLSAAGIHWPDLDEDISYRSMLLGYMSGESGASLQFWRDARRQGKKVTLEDYFKSLPREKRKRVVKQD